MARQQQDVNAIFAKYLANRAPGSTQAQPHSPPGPSGQAPTQAARPPPPVGSCKKPGSQKKLIIVVIIVVVILIVIIVLFKFIKGKRKSAQLKKAQDTPHSANATVTTGGPPHPSQRPPVVQQQPRHQSTQPPVRQQQPARQQQPPPVRHQQAQVAGKATLAEPIPPPRTNLNMKKRPGMPMFNVISKDNAEQHGGASDRRTHQLRQMLNPDTNTTKVEVIVENPGEETGFYLLEKNQ